jgi:thiosulfate/3-mercaptopyruvate sulfurtransferase
MNDYAHPEVLVSTSWVNDHRGDASVKVVEVDVTAASYYEGHIPGALGWDWSKQLCDTLLRDILSKEAFEALMSSYGISPDDTVVLYGDNNNWFAAWALWQMKIYGHRDVRLMNGGRVKWVAEGRELTLDIPKPTRTDYRVTKSDMSLRSLLPDVQTASSKGATNLVDVRSPAEFSGELLAPPGLPETCQRGGHIPGAASIPWGEACNADGTFKSFDDLKALYQGRGVTPSRPTIAYCRIGERSSHSWFVLKYLLGYPDVTNYDGSWTEWGNLVLAPIERDFPTASATR